MSQHKTQLRPADRKAYWYVDDLPPEREVRRSVGRERWISMVNRLFMVDDDGHRFVPTLTGDIPVDGPDTEAWKDLLRSIIVDGGYRMFWEPRPPAKPREKVDPLPFDDLKRDN